MPDVNIHVRTTYDGNGVLKARNDLNDLHERESRIAGGSSSGSSASSIQYQANQVNQSIQSTGIVTSQLASATSSSIGNIQNVSRAAKRELRELQQQLEQIEKFMSGSSVASNNRSLSDTRNRLRSEINSLEQQINAPRIQAEFEKSWSKIQRDLSGRSPASLSTVQDTKVFGSFDQRMRDAERADAKIERDGQRDALRAERDSIRAQNKAISDARRAESEQRRQGMDLFFAGSALSGVGAGALSFTSSNLGALGEAELAQFATRQLEGKNADSVISQARKDARGTFGLGYTDILQYQRFFRDSGESQEGARKDVLAISDAVAAAGKGADVLQRVAVNMAQIRQQATLSKRDLRELDIAQLSGTRRLAQGLGISQEELANRMSSGQVSGEEAFRVLIAQFQKETGGRGRELTENTLPGQLEKTKEQWKELQELLAQGVSPSVRVFNGILREAIQIGESSPGLAKAVGFLTASVGVLAGLGGGTMLATAGSRALGNALPFLQGDKDGGIRSFLFGSRAQEIAANKMLLASENMLLASRGMVTGGVGGSALGAVDDVAFAGASRVGLGARLSSLLGGSISIGGRASVTGAGALGATALGAAGAYQQYGDMQSLGYSSGQAFAGAAATGITESLIAAFVPGGAIAVAIAEGLRFGVDQAYNKPQEGLPENADPDNNSPSMASQKGLSPAQLAAQYRDRARILRNEANQLSPSFLYSLAPELDPNRKRYQSLMDESRAALATANSYDRVVAQGRTKGTPEYYESLRRNGRSVDESAEWQAFLKTQGIGDGSGDAGSGVVSNRGKARVRSMTPTDDGFVATIIIPNHPKMERLHKDVQDNTRG